MFIVMFQLGARGFPPARFCDVFGAGFFTPNDPGPKARRRHAMKVTIEMDMTPQEARAFMGLPDVQPIQNKMMEEMQQLKEALTPPPGSLAIIGGAKFETKQPLIEKLLPNYARILLGGALGNDVIKARGLPVGASLVSSVPASVAIAAEDKLAVTSDVVMEKLESKEARTGLVVDIRADERIADVGPVTATAWAQMAEDAPFVLWNGPLGIYEEGYTEASDLVAKALARSKARAVVGGGDTGAALSKYSFDPAKVFLSTGGGAMLQFLTEGTLPGIEALKKSA